jgi:predicted hydrocarbon binding protein
MLTIMQFGQATVVPWNKIQGEIKEKGAVGIDYDCIFKRAPPEYCIFQSHFSSEFVTEALDPSYECVFTHHLSNGDPYCRYVFKKKNMPNSELDDLGITIATIPKVEIPKEQSQAFTIYGNHMWWQAITGAFVSIYGPEKTKEILMANAHRIGKEVGNNLKNSNKNIGIDANSLGQFINSFEMALNQRGEYKSSISNDISQKEITDCSCQTMTVEICDQYEALLHGILDSINPKYELSYERKMTKGDKTCHWTIRKKGSPIDIEIIPDDPRKALALRFAHGEITEEEFERKMEMLKNTHSSQQNSPQFR